jgi:hypothetical protein
MLNMIAEIVVSPLVWEVPLGFLAIVGLLCIIYWLYIGITKRMAENRNRDPLGWVLLSIIVSPLLTWIILLIVGYKHDD